ncbi:MAG: hypothetical protein WAU96_09410 [Anaerolineae bacterium]
MADKQNDQLESRINEIDRIREIITGPVVSQSSRQYKELKDALDQLRSDFTKQIGELGAQSEASGQYFHAQLQAQSAASQARLEEVDKSLREELQKLAAQLGDSKVDRTSLGDQLIRMGEQLRASKNK